MVPPPGGWCPLPAARRIPRMEGWSRRRLALLAGGAFLFIVVLAVTALLLVMPIVVRGVVIEQLARRTGRDVALATVELNLFKGRLALDGFRLTQRGSSDPALEIERLDVRVAPASLFGDNFLV